MVENFPAQNALPGDCPGILVVDDEPVILTLLRTVLNDRGFRVWTANSASFALSIYETNRNEIQLVLLDVCMPELDGPETLGRLQQLDPEVQVCFMSGYSSLYTPAQLQAMGARRFYEKPLSIRLLADELWDMAVAMRQVA